MDSRFRGDDDPFEGGAIPKCHRCSRVAETRARVIAKTRRIDLLDLRRSQAKAGNAALPEGLLIDDVRHLGWVAGIVAFQNVNQSLNAAAGHTFLRVG